VNRLYARHWEYRDVGCGSRWLRRLEKAQPATIAKVLGISRQLVSYHLNRLEKADGSADRALIIVSSPAAEPRALGASNPRVTDPRAIRFSELRTLVSTGGVRPPSGLARSLS